MSTHIIGFYEDLIQISFNNHKISSNLHYVFFCENRLIEYFSTVLHKIISGGYLLDGDVKVYPKR